MGMNIAKVSRYAVIPTLRPMGLVPNERDMCGIAVVITVPSRFSMKNAPATRSATTT
jgi:hypothetical protein